MAKKFLLYWFSKYRLITIWEFFAYDLKTLNYGTLLAYITESVQSDLTVPELQLHLFQRWTAFQQCIVDEQIE